MSTTCYDRHHSDGTAASRAVVEDVTWLLGSDTPDRIATRVGYADQRALRKVLRRWGHQDLADALSRRPG